MKHGNFKAGRAADIYFNSNKKNKNKKDGTLSLFLKYNFLTLRPKTASDLWPAAGARGGGGRKRVAGGVGAGSEACNRVYMIGPVKTFGLVKLSTNFSFKTNMAEKADMEGRWIFVQF